VENQFSQFLFNSLLNNILCFSLFYSAFLCVEKKIPKPISVFFQNQTISGGSASAATTGSASYPTELRYHYAVNTHKVPIDSVLLPQFRQEKVKV